MQKPAILESPENMTLFHALFPGGKAYDYQVTWCADPSAYRLGVKARQIGITTAEAALAFLECMVWRESEAEPLPPVIVFCSPSQRQSNRLMEYIARIKSRFETGPLQGRTVPLRKDREDFLCFDNHSEIWSLPNNPRTIEGIDASRGIIDEFGNFQGKEDREVYEALMGSLGAKGGGITVFGKPRGRRGLFWQFIDPFGEFTSYFSVHKFPYMVRASLDDRYRETVEAQRTRMTKNSFDEQYLCEFIDEGVLVFPWDVIDHASRDSFLTWSLSRPPEPADTAVYMGIDFARKHDETAITVLDMGADKKARVRFHDVTQAKFDRQIEFIERLIHHFRPVRVRVDETGLGLPMLDHLQAHFATRVEGVLFTQATKERLVLNTRSLMEDGTLLLPDNRELKEQLHGIEKIVLDSGRIKYSGKRTDTDWLDDRAWSLFLAASSIGEEEFSFTVVESAKTKKLTLAEQWARDVDQEGNEL